jgi:hypothetical protein
MLANLSTMLFNIYKIWEKSIKKWNWNFNEIRHLGFTFLDIRLSNEDK